MPKPEILVINDDHGGRHLLVRALSPHYKMSEAATGSEGLQKSMARPDLVLLDVNLPDIDGFEVCRRIKSNPFTAHIPVLHLSATSLDALSRAAGLENGADGYLTLPVETAVMVASINSLLRIKKAETALAESNARLAALSKIDSIFLSTRGERTWQMVLGAVLEFFSSAAGSLGYHNGEGEIVLASVRGACGDKVPAEKAGALPPSTGWKGSRRAGASGGGILVNNGPAGLVLPAGQVNLDRFLCVPLMDDGLMVGHLTIANKAREYSAGDIAFAEIVGGHLAVLLRGRLETEREEALNCRMMGELANTQKIESLGLLAGGIAHDFNNILTGIIGNLSVLNADKTLSGEIMANVKDTLAASVGAQKIVGQLLTFAKGGRPVKKLFNFGAGLASWCSFAMRGSSSKALVQIDLDLWPVNGDEGQLGQAVNNLLRNAREAMPQGGGVKIFACNFEHRSEPGLPLAPGNYVRLIVADNGPGIPAGQLDMIFKPYFTTKTHGHGLGLSMASSIIKNHDGHIHVESSPGSGTEFSVYIPAEPGITPAVRETPAEAQKGSGRVLLMDDEEIVTRAVTRMLEALGYECVCAADGEEALRVYEEALGGPGEFNAVIMDLTIPGGMGGAEAVTKLLVLNPRAKVVVSSGYSEDNAMADYKARGFSAVLVKPYRYEDLAEVLTKLFAGS